jgi:hypothetical protein
MTQPPNQENRQAQAEFRQRLLEESKAPYRGLRQVLYLVFAASGLIGAMIFFLRIISGHGDQELLGNFLLQVGVLVAMISLWRWEQQKAKR